MQNLTPTRPPTEADLLLPAEVARILGVSVGTLEIWRCVKRYPLNYTKIGRLVRYRRSAVQDFINSRTVGAPAVVESEG